MYKRTALENSTEEIEKVSGLLQLTFGNASLFTREYVGWQYRLNPDGHAVGFNAVAENGDLAAHYVTQPLLANFAGREVKGLLSLNTATHPDHRGKGLFTLLAQDTYDHAAAAGYEFVVGVANQNSTHGFIKNLGFQLVCPLQAMIGIGGLDHYAKHEQYEFSRIWNRENLAWRLANPAKKYSMKKYREFTEVYADPGMPFTSALLGYCGNEKIAADALPRNSILKFMKLYIGTKESFRLKSYSMLFNIPMKFRPSPLNLIFKDLTPAKRGLRSGATKFTAIDFDAY
jgi:GNAT superfamily N-acetyltransferase